MKLTYELLHSAGTSGVGFNWAQLRLLGVGMPAAKGWLSNLIGVECPDKTWELVMKLKSVRKKHERKKVLAEYGLSAAKLAQAKIKNHLPMIL